MCPNIITFDAVDFSERHPEEVISFFWRSVYKYDMLACVWRLSDLIYFKPAEFMIKLIIVHQFPL